MPRPRRSSIATTSQPTGSLSEFYSYVDDYNARSRHLCEKLGMRREGLFRSFVSLVNDADGNPVYENTLQDAVLKQEWMAKCETGGDPA